jgi:hypothetical protein
MKLLTIAVLAVMPVLGSPIDVMASEDGTPTSGVSDFYRTVQPDGSLNIFLSVYATNGGGIDFSHEMIFNAAGSGSGYLTVTTSTVINDNAGTASASAVVDGTGGPFLWNIPIILGQDWNVIASASAHAYPVSPPHTTSVGSKIFITVRAFDSFDQPVGIAIISSPEPATFGLMGAALLIGVLRFRRKLC